MPHIRRTAIGSLTGTLTLIAAPVTLAAAILRILATAVIVAFTSLGGASSVLSQASRNIWGCACGG